MTSEKTTTCWACGEIVNIGNSACTECGMPIEENSIDKNDLDSFLEDETKVSSSEQAMPSMPDFEDDSSMPSMPDFDDDSSMPSMPDFDDDSAMPSMPDFDDDSAIPSMPEIEETPQKIDWDDLTDPSSNSSETITEELSSDMPSIPDFEDALSEEEEIEEDQKTISREKISISDISLSQTAILFISQWTYWTIVFIILSFVSIQLIDPNISLKISNRFQPYQFEIFPEAFIFSWICFIPMGFFYGYKLRTKNIIPKTKYIAIYLTGQLIWLFFLSGIALFLLNPEFLSGSYNQYYNVFSTYFIFSIYLYVVSLLTAGLLIFYASYKIYWSYLYALTPLSKYNQSLLDL